MSYFAKVLPILVAFAVCMQCACHNNESCNTQFGQSGRCVPFKKCPKMVALRETAKYAQQLQTLIAHLGACGSDANTDPTDALICCESPADTPTTQPTTARPKTARPTTARPTTIKPPATTTRVITTPRTTTTTTMRSMTRTIPSYSPGSYKIPCGKLPVAQHIYSEVEDSNHVHIWAVLLELTAGKSLCAGSLLTELYVLTAAHCVRGVDGDDITMYFGLYDRRELADCLDDTSCQERKASKIVMHEEYNAHLKQNDIALVGVDHRLTFTDYVGPICLPVNQTYDESLPASNVVSYGWGETLNGMPSDTKRVAHLRAVKHEECKTLLKKTSPLPSHYMCTIGMKTGQDVCQGDSGAPLVWLHEKRMYVVGVVSHGPKCGMNTNLPGIAMRVTEFLDWILWNIKS